MHYYCTFKRKQNQIMKFKLLFTSLLLIGLVNFDAPKDKPLNFIIIFTDDMGYGDLSSFGHPTIKTPNLDKMAMQGQKWTNFYVASPVCTPSRAALLTGRYPIRNGMTSAKRGVLFPNSAKGLPQSEVTIAEVLKQKSYATAAIGKWHLGHLPEFLPENHGFDSYYGIPYSNDMNYSGEWSEQFTNAEDPYFRADYKKFNVPIIENGKIIEQPADQNTITYRYTQKAVDFIKTNKETPFFLYLAHSLPHIPLFAHPDRVGQSTQGIYGDVIEEIDWSVGRILSTLKELELDKNTVVVFTSDNGPWLAFKTHGGSAGPLRAGKGTTFEGGQRVPTIFWGPGNVKPQIVHEMGSTLDLINTIGSLSGTQTPKDRKMDGVDLSPVLKGNNTTGPRSSFYYWSTKAELYAVRSGKWKLHLQQSEPVLYWNPTEPLEQPILYNLDADVSEKYDVADKHSDIVAKLKKMAREHEMDITDPLEDNLAPIISKN